jgi:hypothetical protein
MITVYELFCGVEKAQDPTPQNRIAFAFTRFLTSLRLSNSGGAVYPVLN